EGRCAGAGGIGVGGGGWAAGNGLDRSIAPVERPGGDGVEAAVGEVDRIAVAGEQRSRRSGRLGCAANFAEVDVVDGLTRRDRDDLSTAGRSGFSPIGSGSRTDAICAGRQIGKGILSLAVAG